MSEVYPLLVVVHLILFAWWLGGDYGVFVTSRYVARTDLPVAERARFLEALMAIDILPRTAIVLLPMVGLQMAVLRGSIVMTNHVLALIWLIDILWLCVVWMAYLCLRTPAGEKWQRVDVYWRLGLICCLLWLGASSLISDHPVASTWIAAKLLVYSSLLIVGLYLRLTIRAWKEGFARLRAGIEGPETDALFTDARRRARYVAYLFWSLIVTMAWLGVRQPA